MKDYEKIASPMYVPPLMLKIVTANLTLWLIVLPLALAIRDGASPEWLTIAVCGIPLVGAVILGMFISRLIAFGYYTLFWFWQGLIALVATAVGVVALMAIIFQPERILPALQSSQQSRELTMLFTGVLPGALIGASITIAVIATLWMLKRGRAARKEVQPRPQPMMMPPPPPEPTAPKKKELTYMQDWEAKKG